MSPIRIALNRGFLQRVSLLAALGCFLVRPAGAGINRWTNIGPDGGLVNAIAIDPTSPLTMDAAAGGGGIRKSVDGGASWRAINVGLTNLFATALAIDPTSPSTLYAGTRGGGVFKSMDGGARWTSVNNLTEVSITALAIDPVSPSTLYVGTDSYGGVFKTVNGGESWTAINNGLSFPIVNVLVIDPVSPSTLYVGDDTGTGLFRSVDGGASWTNLFELDVDEPVLALAVDPTSPSTLYVSVNGSVSRSTNEGASWQSMSRGITDYVSALAVDPTSPSTVYAGTFGGSVFKTPDAGANWAPIGSGMASVFALVIDRTSPSTAYAGTGTGLFRSADGGATWTLLPTGLRNLAVDSMVIDPSSPSTLYAAAGNGVGVLKSTDGGTTWALMNDGLPTPFLRHLAIDPRSTSTLYAGTLDDGVFKTTDGGLSWNPINAGLPLPLFVGAFAVSAASPSTLYVGLPFAGVFKSTNGGSSWAEINNGLTNVGHYVSALAVNPTSPSSVYLASPPTGRPDTSAKIFSTTSGGASWKELYALPNGSVQVFAIDPGSPSTVYAGTDVIGVLKSTDSGATWAPVNDGLTDLNVTSLAISPSAGIVYAGTAFGGVFKSTNGGSTWTSLNLGLSNLRVASLAIDDAGRVLYAGTQGGGVFEFEPAAVYVPCVPSPDRLCLLAGRFEVRLTAVDPATGAIATGQAVPQGARFGYFSVMSLSGDAALPEVVVKMADVTSLPPPFGGSFWIFYGGLTTLRYTLTVTDTATGRVRIYEGEGICGGADTSAFPGQASGLASSAFATTLAAGEGPELLLRGGRFRVSVLATDPRTGTTSPGAAIPQGDLFGYFSLPGFTGDPSFPEVFVKMTVRSDGSISIFHSGLTDLSYTLTITDTGTGVVRTYKNEPDDPTKLCGGADTKAFPPNPPTYGRWEVWGRVFGDSPARSLIGARVEVVDGRFAGRYAIVTEAGGVSGGSGYVIRDLDPILLGVPAGTVTLRASQPGYQNQTMTAYLCLLGPVLEEECNNDFYLQPAN